MHNKPDLKAAGDQFEIKMICRCNTRLIIWRNIDNITSMKTNFKIVVNLVPMLFLLVAVSSCGKVEERNREVARLFYYGILNEKNTGLIDEIISREIEFYRPDHKGDRFGIKAFRDYISLNHRMSPDLNVVIDDMIAEGNKVAVRYNISGTEKNSGNKYSAEGIALLQIDDGKITRLWENADDLNFLIQIDHIPEIDYPHKHVQE